MQDLQRLLIVKIFLTISSPRLSTRVWRLDSNDGDSVSDAAHPDRSQGWGILERRPKMAPAQSASASTGTDSIKGLAQSVAKPAYRRLLVAEPALRRAVPILIIAFLVTMAVGAMVQISDHRRQAVASVTRELQTIADLVAERLDRDTKRPKGLSPAGLRKFSTRSLSQLPLDGHRFLVSDARRQHHRHAARSHRPSAEASRHARYRRSR